MGPGKVKKNSGTEKKDGEDNNNQSKTDLNNDVESDDSENSDSESSNNNGEKYIDFDKLFFSE